MPILSLMLIWVRIASRIWNLPGSHFFYITAHMSFLLFDLDLTCDLDLWCSWILYAGNYMNTYLNRYYTPLRSWDMPFQISLYCKMTTPQKVALVPPWRGRKNGAQADFRSWMLFALISTSNSKWASNSTRELCIVPWRTTLLRGP